MIGIIGNPRRDGKSSFKTLISYCKDREGVAHSGSQNIYFGDAAAEMEALAFENARCKDPLTHIILSWRETELPTNRQIDEAVKIALKELDLQNCQAVWIAHSDTENRHVHIAVNRVDPETHKAIRPAGGWTYKAIQRASRKIELAQGWELETHGSCRVTEDGELAASGEESGKSFPKLSKAALDSEAHTARKSAGRIAQETAAKIIREAKSWEELHEKLAEQGIAFERKGSGALLVIGGAAVKASETGRDLSLPKLEARLGEYRPRAANVRVRERPAEPVERVTERKVTGQWERYTAAREKYFREKNEAFAALSGRQKSERAELLLKQRGEREELFSRSWKGMGTALNRQRSVTAAKQQAEKLDLRDRQSWEREELKKLFPARFPNFKTWLGTKEKTPEAFISFRYSNNSVIWSGNRTTAGAASPQPDLRAFTPIAWNKGGVAYSLKDAPNEAQFIDCGKKIVMAEKCGETAILAALQLANQKWGSAEISGAEEYKRACVALAIRHNLRISNPDLAAEVEEMKKRKMNQAEKIKNGREAFERYANAVDAEKFRITVTEITEEGTKAFIFDRQNNGYDGKTREEISGAIPRFSVYARYGKNIIVTPMSGDKHHILVDDMTEEKLRRFKDDGYSPACVIESSPGNFQAIITVPSVAGDAAKDREAANRLTRELNQKYGDPKLSGSIHGHRLPPFPNQKPKHKREDGTFPDTALIEANGGTCEKARLELEAIHSALKEAEAKAREMAALRRAVDAQSSGANDPDGAYWAHCRDILSAQGAPDYSSVDGKIGIRMRVTGYSQGQIQAAIEANAPATRRGNMTEAEYASKYGGRDWRRYAKETAEKFVFGPRGLNQYESARSYRPKFLRVEGRDAREEARREYERKSAAERQEEQFGR